MPANTRPGAGKLVASTRRQIEVSANLPNFRSGGPALALFSWLR
jgi:hypothetical protein